MHKVKDIRGIIIELNRSDKQWQKQKYSMYRAPKKKLMEACSIHTKIKSFPQDQACNYREQS